MVALTVPVDERTATALEDLAAKLDRPASALAGEAIAGFVALQTAHFAEIEAGLADADAGRFATDTEVALTLGKYLRPRK